MLELIEKIRQDPVHYLELVAVLLVSLVVFFLHVFHLVAIEFVQSAILLTLGLLAFGLLKARVANEQINERLEKFSNQARSELGLEWYAHRVHAESDMQSVLPRYRRLVFIGISHQRLAKILNEAMEDKQDKPQWEHIEIYFASDDLGTSYQGSAFKNNLRNVRQQIACLLTSPHKRYDLPYLKDVSFFQEKYIIPHSGSMFADAQCNFDVIYVVSSGVTHAGDTVQGLTFRLSKTVERDKLHSARMLHYTAVYKSIRKDSFGLGKFSRSIWDESAEAWSLYASQSAMMKNSMNGLLSLAKIQAGDKILDLGAGAGDLWEDVELGSDTELTLLDASPQMIYIARRRFSSRSGIKTALCSLPGKDREEIDLGEQHFSLIMIHQSLPELAESDAFKSLYRLATWCHDRLMVGGRVVIAIHNGGVEVEPPARYKNWEDPFRKLLLEKLSGDKTLNRHLQPLGARLLEQDIQGAFVENGFHAASPIRREFRIDYEERKLMWQIPAVMNSIIDVRQVGMDKLCVLVEDVAGQLRGQETMPRVTLYWRFERS